MLVVSCLQTVADRGNSKKRRCQDKQDTSERSTSGLYAKQKQRKKQDKKEDLSVCTLTMVRVLSMANQHDTRSDRVAHN
jgi:hypothetical protein